MPNVYSSPWFFQQFLDDSGYILSYGKVRTKYAGTSTDKATYSDSDGASANTNPVILDAAGRCQIFLVAGSYDIYVYDSADVLIKTIEGVNAQTATIEVDTQADLRALSAGANSILRTLGSLSKNDGGGWVYYWDSTSSATDDGGMIIQPDSLPATGRYLGLLPENREVNVRVFKATCDGTTDDITELQACDTWCAANSCTILIDASIYVATNPSLSSRVHLLPSAQFRYGNFNPTIDLLIDDNDVTQHFNCAVGDVPTLNCYFVYPEWFGETVSSYPITTAVIGALTGQKSKYIKAESRERLYGTKSFANGIDTVGIDNTGDIDITSGGLTIGSPGGGSANQGEMASEIIRTDAVIGNLDIYEADDTLILGADFSAETRTDSTDKRAHLSAVQYDNSEEGVTLIQCANTTSSNSIHIGGGSNKNAATLVDIYTSSIVNNLAGTRQVGITSDGVIIGNPTGSYKGTGTINATGVYDDNVLLTGYVLDHAYNLNFNTENWIKLTPKPLKRFLDKVVPILDIDKYCNYVRENKVLPTFEDIEKTGEISSTGDMIQRLWEVVEVQAVHIDKLNERVKELERKLS